MIFFQPVASQAPFSAMAASPKPLVHFGKNLKQDDLLTFFSKEELHALKWLEKIKQHQSREPIIFFTDPGKDPDDTLAAIIGAYLEKMGLMQLLAAVTTLGYEYTRKLRAQLLQGTWEPLGIQVPIAPGRNYSIPEHRIQDDNLFFEIGHLLTGKQQGIVKNAQKLLQKKLNEAAPDSVTLLGIAGMSDMAELIEKSPDLFRDKVKQVVIMGGIRYKTVPVFEADQVTVKKDIYGKPVYATLKDKKGNPIPELDGEGFIQPDERAFNNTTDQLAAQKVYRASQLYGKKLVILSKEAAYQAPLSYEFYKNLQVTRHPLAQFVSKIQFVSLERLWWKVRFNIDKALTMPWFLKVFTDVDPVREKQVYNHLNSNSAGFDEIWKRATKLNAYDPLALLAAIPAVGESLFKPHTMTHPVHGNVVQVIDGSSVRDPKKIRSVLSALSKQAILSTQWREVVSSSLLKEHVIV